jgi:hypothetical protein
MLDLYKNIKVTQLLAAATKTATTESSSIDRQGYDGLMLAAVVGLSADTLNGSTYWTMSLTESDDNSTFTDVADTDVVTSTGTNDYVVDALAEDEKTYMFKYIGSKRYVKVNFTKTGTHTNGTPLAALAIQGLPNYGPVTQDN